MAKESESVVAGSTRVLRPRAPTGDAKVNEWGMVKVPKATGKLKSGDASNGKLKSGDAGKGHTVMKRKLTDAEGACTRAKLLKAMHKTEMNKGAASQSTRVLRSAKKENGAVKGVVEECAKAKTRKGFCSLATDFTSPESSGKRVTRSATKGQVAVQPNGKSRATAKTK